MNTKQIDEIFKKYSYTRKIYKGTRAFDELPKKITRPSAYIINTETLFLVVADVRQTENLRFPCCFKENVSVPNEIYRHHQIKFDFLY